MGLGGFDELKAITTPAARDDRVGNRYERAGATEPTASAGAVRSGEAYGPTVRVGLREWSRVGKARTCVYIGLDKVTSDCRRWTSWCGGR